MSPGEGPDHNDLLYAALPCIIVGNLCRNLKNAAIIFGLSGLTLTTIMVESANGCELAVMSSSIQFSEPSNALSLHTWASHVSSVVEWVAAMALVWQYGEKSGYESWKGLSWAMVPLLGGALCACTWHFFYNAESLERNVLRSMVEASFAKSLFLGEPKPMRSQNRAKLASNSERRTFPRQARVVVALQAALTVIGNATMCFAAFRIYRSSQKQSKKL
ncbi:putative Golgi apparatus membrane protein TVP38-like [Capsicum annuum]|nr:putative Golgi apparatus membrane protein TVP38-like [Capsicum annuum]